MNPSLSRSLCYVFVIGFTLSIPHTTQAIALPKFTFLKACEVKDYAKITAVLALTASIARLYTKKTTPQAVLPADDSFEEWLRYVIDELWIGMIGKSERLDNINPITGDCKYKKLDARGVLGVIATSCKDQWLPALIVAATAHATYEQILKAYELIRLNLCQSLPKIPNFIETPAKAATPANSEPKNN